MIPVFSKLFPHSRRRPSDGLLYKLLSSTSHGGGMADAYGSGLYGETRGGSTPLVSILLFELCTFAKYLSHARQIRYPQ